MKQINPHNHIAPMEKNILSSSDVLSMRHYFRVAILNTYNPSGRVISHMLQIITIIVEKNITFVNIIFCLHMFGVVPQ